MNKEQIENRIKEIKKENDGINHSLTVLDNERQQLVQKAITNNGRILELENILKEI